LFAFVLDLLCINVHNVKQKFLVANYVWIPAVFLYA